MRGRKLLMSGWMLLTLGAGMAQGAGGAGTPRTPTVRAYWERTVLGLAPWAPAVTYEAGSGVVEFTGAQGRRRQATVTLPAAGQPVAGAVLVLDQAAPADPAGDAILRMYAPALSGAPGAREEQARATLLDAYQAVSVLAAAAGVRAGKVALVGRGEAAGLALALAALRPGEVGAVVLVDPQAPAGATTQWDLAAFARLVRCPALLVAERTSRATPLLDTLAEALGGPRTTVDAPHGAGARYWPWLAEVFASAAEPGPAPGEQPAAEEGGMPVDLSQQ